MKRVKIYGLTDSMGIIRDIGKTERTPRKRLIQHLGEARRGGKNHRCNWLRSLAEPPGIVILEELDFLEISEWEAREKYWIALARDYGHRLVNSTEGGEGASGYKHTEEGRAKMRQAHVKNPRSAEQIAKLVAACIKARTGVPHSPETRAKQSAASKNVLKSAAHREALTGKKRKNASSRFHGVFKVKGSNKYRAAFRGNGKRIHLGYFITEEAAARAVDVYIKENSLSLKLLNFPSV